MFRLVIASLTLVVVTSLADPIGDLSTGNNRFAISLFREMTKSEPGNLVVSPFSLETALCMAYTGARGETAQQMETVLQIESLGKGVHAAQQDLSSNLRVTCNSDTVAKLSIANALWNAKCTAKLDFTRLLRARYQADVRQLSGNPKADADAINAWADLNTGHRVPQVVEPGDFGGPIAVVITNAVYFLGRWQYPFQAAKTTNRTFWRNGRDSVQVPMMHADQYGGRFKVIETDEFQAIELPYKQSSAVMDIFLPRKRGGLAEFEAALTSEMLTKQISRFPSEPSEVDLVLPKVKTEGKWKLNTPLAEMGMPLAFTDQADFSNMCSMSVWIDKVVHATFLQMDELGTEAAAVTTVHMALTAYREPPPAFHADHPFFFVIRDTATNTILFIGHITDPRQ